eukprot:5142667-Amphidinium_carterae.1
MESCANKACPGHERPLQFGASAADGVGVGIQHSTVRREHQAVVVFYQHACSLPFVTNPVWS